MRHIGTRFLRLMVSPLFLLFFVGLLGAVSPGRDIFLGMSEAKLLGVVAVRFRLRGRDLARCYGQTGRREPALQGSGRISRSQRLLDDGDGDLIATSDAFQRRDEGNAVGPHAIAAFVALGTAAAASRLAGKMAVRCLRSAWATRCALLAASAVTEARSARRWRS